MLTIHFKSQVRVSIEARGAENLHWAIQDQADFPREGALNRENSQQLLMSTNALVHGKVSGHSAAGSPEISGD